MPHMHFKLSCFSFHPKIFADFLAISSLTYLNFECACSLVIFTLINIITHSNHFSLTFHVHSKIHSLWNWDNNVKVDIHVSLG